MKPEDISEALGLVDPEYISGSAPAAKKKSGKLLKILIPAAALIAIALALGAGAYAIAQNGIDKGPVRAPEQAENAPDKAATQAGESGMPEYNGGSDGAPAHDTDEPPTDAPTVHEPADDAGSEPVVIDNYDVYLSFISENEMPDRFVSYDEISSLGEFVRFVYCDENTGPYQPGEFKLDYSLRDENGFVFVLQIASAADKTDDPNAELSLAESGDDLRTRDGNERNNMRMAVSNAEYHYDNRGRLFSITWSRSSDLYYCILAHDEKTGASDLHNYPSGGADTLLSRLLNKAGAEEATESFIDIVIGKEGKD